MLRVVEGLGVLFLLSLFFAYLLAPAVDGIRRRVRTGGRNRPISRAAALLILYAVLITPVALVWHFSGDAVSHWVHVTAPASVDMLFSGARSQALDRAMARVPLPDGARLVLRGRVASAVRVIEREARETLHDLIDAAPLAPWLAVAPVLAFLALTVAPGFRRSTLRILPHGHLQWRAEEYARDVNSALAGYVRAQTAAGVIVGVFCVAGFALIGVPSAVSLGVSAGILELVPALGPMTAFLVAATQAGDRLLAVIVFLTGLRIVQDYVIYPRLIRRGMHLSTLAVILTIWTGAALAGAAGVILAIPVAGLISVSARHWREYREVERLVRQHERRSNPESQIPNPDQRQ
jgi:predicted PurR-regulated permease PerM